MAIPSISALRELRAEGLRQATAEMRSTSASWRAPPEFTLSVDSLNWNFSTFEKFINQRFSDLSLQLRERYEAQQAGFTAAITAAEKAVNAALIATEKAVNKAEDAQQLRNEAQNEFRKSLSDLSGLMWTTKEGTAMVDALRREIAINLTSIQARVGMLEAQNANIQGRIWAVSATFAIIALIVSVGVRFIH